MKSNTQNEQHQAVKNVRIHHHRLDKEYSVIANHGVENENLSFAAKGLLWYMISRESSFEIHTWHLANLYKGEVRGNGVEAIRTMLDELKSEGYVVHHKYQDQKGQWQHRYDVYPLPLDDFQKMFPHRVKPSMDEAGTVKPDVLPITKLPITELPITKNPPLSSPPKKESLPRKKSLRSEEEEVSIFDFLEGTKLSSKDKHRLSKYYTREQVQRALKISETQKIKKTLMSLLINILDNPDKWPDAAETQLETHQQRIASSYNESLRKSTNVGREAAKKPGEKEFEIHKGSDIAKENDKTIPTNSIKVFLNGIILCLSLNSLDFEQDIKDATAQLR